LKKAKSVVASAAQGFLVGTRLKQLDLFLETKLLAFQVADSGGIGGGPDELVVDGSLETLVLDAEFAKAGARESMSI